MSQNLVLIGIALIFIGMLLVIIGGLSGAKTSSTKVAIGGFIGPIPFGFANDPRFLKIIIGLSLVLIAIFLLFPTILKYLS